jgi:tRNA-(ms[2]io[6]A)-hydroxylase
MLRLKSATSPEWVRVVLADLNSFLLDHAFCERKASGTALKLASQYPDKLELVSSMIDLAREELEHFALVYRELEARGILLSQDGPDPYVNHLLKLVRKGRDESFLDRLLVAALIEGRSCERFLILTDALPDGPLRELYLGLTRSEARHHGLFLHLAKRYVSSERVEARFAEMLDAEAEIVASLPLRAAVH